MVTRLMLHVYFHYKPEPRIYSPLAEYKSHRCGNSIYQLNWISEIQEPVVPWSKVLQHYKIKQNLLHSSNQAIQ